MRAAVFGGTGKSGLRIIDTLLAEGFNVSALVRDKKKLGKLLENERLDRTIEGSVRDYQPVLDTIRDADVVISALGVVGYGQESSGLMLDSTQNFVKALKETGCRHLIFMGGVLVGRPGESMTLASFFRPLLSFTGMWNDIVKAFAIMEDPETQKDIEWILVRPPHLTEEDVPIEERKSRYEHLVSPKFWSLRNSISRDCVADFIVDVAKDAVNPNSGSFQYWKEYKYKAPVTLGIAKE
jgi:putative NADH-flavin reductase